MKSFLSAPDTKAYLVFLVGVGLIVGLVSAGHTDALVGAMGAYTLLATIFLGHDVGDTVVQRPTAAQVAAVTP